MRAPTLYELPGRVTGQYQPDVTCTLMTNTDLQLKRFNHALTSTRAFQRMAFAIKICFLSKR